MSSAATLDILIRAREDLAGIRRSVGALDELKRKAESVAAVLAAGFGLNLGERLAGGLFAAKDQLSGIIDTGIRFNATLESARNGIAGVMKQFDTTGQLAEFPDALKAAGQAIDILKEKALQSPATFEQLVQAYQSTAGVMASTGMSMRQQVETIVMMSQALAGLGISSDQMVQETRSLISGDITADSQAAKTLGITSEMISGAKEQGRLFDFLKEKMSGLSQAAAYGATSYTTAMSNIQDALTQAAADMTQDIFDGQRKGFLDLQTAMKSQEFKDGMEQILKLMMDLRKAGMEAAVWMAQHPQVISKVATAIGALVAALATIQIGRFIADNVKWVASLAGNVVALNAETAALARNTTAKAANAAVPAGGAASRGGNALAAVGRGAGAVAIGAALGWYIQQDQFNWGGAVGMGRATSETDMAAAQEMTSNQGMKISSFYDEAKRINSSEDQDALGGKIYTYRQSLEKDLSETSWNQGGQREVLESSIAALDRLGASIAKMDPAKLDAKAAALESETKASKDAENARKEREGRDKVSDSISAQLVEAERAKRFAAMSPEDQLSDVKRRMSDARENYEGASKNGALETQQAAGERMVALTSQLNQLEAQIAENKKQQEESSATEAKNKADSVAKKTREVELELAKGEAAAKGDAAAQRRIAFQEKYNALVAEGVDPRLAARSAAAEGKSALEQQFQTRTPQLSDLARRGGNAAENIEAARAAAAQDAAKAAAQKTIDEMAKNTTAQKDLTKAIEKFPTQLKVTF